MGMKMSMKEEYEKFKRQKIKEAKLREKFEKETEWKTTIYIC